MAVRVKIEMDFGGKRFMFSALANAGYETDDDEILIPLNLARKIGATGGEKVRYHTAGGDADFLVVEEVPVKVIVIGRKSKSIKARLVVSPYEKEIILNDKLVEDLSIVLVKVKQGKWRFLDDPPDTERPSEPRESF